MLLSPTGSLHIGGARTALFNYLYAKKNNGSFKIRIEDTDKSRNTQNSVESILNGLNWLGLKTDQKVIFQSDNKKNHIEIVRKMIEQGLAYKCFHNENELIEKRKNNKKFKSEWRDKKVDNLKKKTFVLELNHQLKVKVVYVTKYKDLFK